LGGYAINKIFAKYIPALPYDIAKYIYTDDIDIKVFLRTPSTASRRALNQATIPYDIIMAELLKNHNDSRNFKIVRFDDYIKYECIYRIMASKYVDMSVHINHFKCIEALTRFNTLHMFALVHIGLRNNAFNNRIPKGAKLLIRSMFVVQPDMKKNSSLKDMEKAAKLFANIVGRHSYVFSKKGNIPMTLQSNPSFANDWQKITAVIEKAILDIVNLDTDIADILRFLYEYEQETNNSCGCIQSALTIADAEKLLYDDDNNDNMTFGFDLTVNEVLKNMEVNKVLENMGYRAENKYRTIRKQNLLGMALSRRALSARSGALSARSASTRGGSSGGSRRKNKRLK
jgi:hypothetical protein